MYAGSSGGRPKLRLDDISISAEETDVEGLSSGNEMSLNIYPNPLLEQGTISYSIDNPGCAEILLSDIFGKEIKKIYAGLVNAGKNAVSLNIRDLPSGVYFCTLRIKARAIVRKIIIIRD